jgi:hypothetical protein
LHKRLEQLGAKEIYPRGEGDEQHPEGLVLKDTITSMRSSFDSSAPLAETAQDIVDEFLAELMELFYHGPLILGSTFSLHILCRKE